jgi:hypothetical protein
MRGWIDVGANPRIVVGPLCSRLLEVTVKLDAIAVVSSKLVGGAIQDHDEVSSLIHGGMRSPKAFLDISAE